jgi:serine/threonine protein kinase
MTRTAPTRQQAPAWEVGREPIPGYRVLAHMHRGRDLDVYDVWSTERRCRCVLKTTRPDRATGSVVQLVRREGRLLLECTHPSLVRAYDLLETEDGPVLVLEALPGATLAVLLDEHRRLDPQDIGHLGVHLTSAVYYLHSRGYLHLDVKPGNIVAHRGRATLIDMSLVRPPGPCPHGRGTPGYMAPEQMGGDLGPATDVWGIGAVLYEAATGKPVIDPDDLSDPGSDDSHSDGIDSDSIDSDDIDSGRVEPGRVEPGRVEPGRVEPGVEPDAGVEPGRVATNGGATKRLPARPPRVRARRRLPVDIAAVIDACLEADPARRPTVEVVADAMATLSGVPPDGVHPR